MLKRAIVLSLFIILSVNIVWAENINFQEDDENICFDTIHIYFIYGSNLEICLSEPSIDKLDKLSYSKYVSAKYIKNKDYIYFNGYNVENGISKKCTEKYKVEDENVVYNPKYLKMLSEANLDNVLKNSGIYSGLKSTAIIVTNWSNNVYPHIIWIRTQDDKNYYMASDYYFSFEWDKNWNNEVYNYNWNNQKVMNQDEFNKKYLWNEGTLYFDNNIVTDKFNPIFQRYVVRVPFRTLLEIYGFSDIKFDKDNCMILAYSLKEKKKYAFLLPIMENKKDLNLLLDNDIEQKQLYSAAYELLFRNGKFYMSPHGFINFLGNAFGDYSYSYNIDLKNKSVSFYKSR